MNASTTAGEREALPPDLAEQREELGHILGVGQPVAEQVLLAALEDDDYARNLLLCRRDPELLGYLLSHPPASQRRRGVAELAARGASALSRWAATGFTTVDEATYAARMAACEACPQLTNRESRHPACGLCGCRVRWKARLSSESCPGRSPEDPALTRWGEPAIVSSLATTPRLQSGGSHD